jgi:hypothetical protein
MHETKATIRLRKRAGHAVLQGVALSRGVAIGGAAEVWAGGRPMAKRRRKRGTDATAGGWEPEIMISEAKDSQARSSTLSARFFFEKGVDYWCFVCGVGCRTLSELPGKACFCHLPLHYPSTYIVTPEVYILLSCNEGLLIFMCT